MDEWVDHETGFDVVISVPHIVFSEHVVDDSEYDEHGLVASVSGAYEALGISKVEVVQHRCSSLHERDGLGELFYDQVLLRRAHLWDHSTHQKPFGGISERDDSTLLAQ